MINQIYKDYKKDYNHAVILIKSGNFYLALNKDSFVLHNLFGYIIKPIKNGYKVGFPINSLEKITSELKNKQISYLVIDNKEITKRYIDDNNLYKNYVSKKNYDILYNRIDKITETLKAHVDDDLESILSEIENVLCMID